MTTTSNTANTVRNINSILNAPKTVYHFADKKYRFPHAENRQNDTGIVIVLPEGVEGYYWSLDTNLTLAKTDYTLNF